MFVCAQPCLSSHACNYVTSILSFTARLSQATCCELCCVPNVTGSSCKFCVSFPYVQSQATIHTLSHIVIADCHPVQVPVTLTQVHIPKFACQPQMHCLKDHCTHHHTWLVQVATQCKCQWPPRWSLPESAFLKWYC